MLRLILVVIAVSFACSGDPEPQRELRDRPREAEEMLVPAPEPPPPPPPRPEVVATKTPGDLAQALHGDQPAPTGTIHLLAPSYSRGRIPENTLRAALEGRLDELTACYNEVLQEDHTARGRVVVEWSVVGGRVQDVSIVRPVRSDGIHACLETWLGDLRVRAGGRVVMTQPFLFHHSV